MIKTLLESTEVASENSSNPVCVCKCARGWRVRRLASQERRRHLRRLTLTPSTPSGAKARPQWHAISATHLEGWQPDSAHVTRRARGQRLRFDAVSNRTCFKGRANPQKWGMRSIFPCLIGYWLIWFRNSLRAVLLSWQSRPTPPANLNPETSVYETGRRDGQADGQTAGESPKKKKREWNWDLTSKC